MLYLPVLVQSCLTLNYSDPSRSSTAQQPPPPPPRDTVASIWRTSWLPLSGAALLAGFLGFYIIGTATATLKAPSCASSSTSSNKSSTTPSQCGEHATPTGRPPALSGENAEQFDKELNLGEWWMGITSLRRRIASHARGQVLELAMGTGRNLEYYDWAPIASDQNSGNTKLTAKGITTFTGLDISVDMLDVARKRLVATVEPMKDQEPVVKASTMVDHTGGQLSYLSSRLRLIHSDAHHPLPPPPSSPSSKYDTIIQTFGLCSVSDPIGVLTNLASAVKRDTGRIILLEHGKGWYGIVNGLLDRHAEGHFERYGCWWNRDIQQLVEEAARRTPGLEVVKIERPKVLQMGTMVWVELKVVSGSAQKA